MREAIIWRGDDVQQSSDLKLFKQAHELFIKYNVLHTVALICNEIEKNKPLVKYIKQQVKNKSMDVQVHCWNHFEFPKDPVQVDKDLPKCIEVIKRLSGKMPDTLYLPWNKSDSVIDAIAWKHHLKSSYTKISLEQYLRGVKGTVINWHFWADEVKDLEPALIKYTL